jgi:hypothetical protein
VIHKRPVSVVVDQGGHLAGVVPAAGLVRAAVELGEINTAVELVGAFRGHLGLLYDSHAKPARTAPSPPRCRGARRTRRARRLQAAQGGLGVIRHDPGGSGVRNARRASGGPSRASGFQAEGRHNTPPCCCCSSWGHSSERTKSYAKPGSRVRSDIQGLRYASHTAFTMANNQSLSPCPDERRNSPESSDFEGVSTKGFIATPFGGP